MAPPLTPTLLVYAVVNASGAFALRTKKLYWPCSAHSLLCLAELEARALTVLTTAALALFAALALRPGNPTRAVLAAFVALADLFSVGASVLRFHPQLLGVNLYRKFKLTTGEPLSPHSLPPQVSRAALTVLAVQAVLLLVFAAAEAWTSRTARKRKAT